MRACVRDTCECVCVCSVGEREIKVWISYWANRHVGYFEILRFFCLNYQIKRPTHMQAYISIYPFSNTAEEWRRRRLIFHVDPETVSSSAAEERVGPHAAHSSDQPKHLQCNSDDVHTLIERKAKSKIRTAQGDGPAVNDYLVLWRQYFLPIIITPISASAAPSEWWLRWPPCFQTCHCSGLHTQRASVACSREGRGVGGGGWTVKNSSLNSLAPDLLLLCFTPQNYRGGQWFAPLS